MGTVARKLAARLLDLIGTRVSGPDEPTVEREQTGYIPWRMLKIEITSSISKVKTLLNEVRIDMTNRGRLSGASVYCDVDPM